MASSDKDFTLSFSNYDIISLLETWTSYKDQFCDLLTVYGCFTLQGYRRGRRGHYNGGIIIFVKSSIFKSCKRVCCESNIRIYITVPGNLFDTNGIMLLACLYLPHEGSPFYAAEPNGIMLLEDELSSVVTE